MLLKLSISMPISSSVRGCIGALSSPSRMRSTVSRILRSGRTNRFDRYADRNAHTTMHDADVTPVMMSMLSMIWELL